MRRIPCIAVIAAVTLVLGPGSRLEAQEQAQERAQEQGMTSGTWGGILLPPGDDAAELQFEVTSEDAAISITMVIPDFGELPLDDVTLEDDTLRFSFDIGLVVKCSLVRGEDGGFSGECTSGDGESGQLTMTPPAEG